MTTIQKSKKQILLEAQEEQAKEIANQRLKLLQGLADLDAFGGEDDYKISLTTILDAYGNEGISLTSLRMALPDPVKLKTAVEELKTEGKIAEEEKGRSSILTATTQQP